MFGFLSGLSGGSLIQLGLISGLSGGLLARWPSATPLPQKTLQMPTVKIQSSWEARFF